MFNRILLNKQIRKYDGENIFILSLKKQLSSKYCNKIEIDGKLQKVLSDKQYEIAESILNTSN